MYLLDLVRDDCHCPSISNFATNNGEITRKVCIVTNKLTHTPQFTFDIPIGIFLQVILPDQAKDRLLTVALLAFVNRGYEAVGVQEIVDQAHVTKPTLYHHFSSKIGLLQALCARLSAVLRAELLPVLTYDGDLPKQLTALIRVMLSVARSRPAEFRLLLLLHNAPLHSPSRQSGKPVIDWLHRQVERIFEDACAQHGNMAGRARQFSVTLLATMFAYGLLIIDGLIHYSDGLPHEVMHQFSYGVYS